MPLGKEKLNEDEIHQKLSLRNIGHMRFEVDPNAPPEEPEVKDADPADA